MEPHLSSNLLSFLIIIVLCCLEKSLSYDNKILVTQKLVPAASASNAKEIVCDVHDA